MGSIIDGYCGFRGDKGFKIVVCQLRGRVRMDEIGGHCKPLTSCYKHSAQE